MKELFSSLTATVFNPLVSLVLPGLTAISGWFVFFAQRQSLDGLISRNHTETAFVLMLLTIFVGTIVDDLGMRIESLWLDAGRDRRTHGSHSEEWWAYLRKPFVCEPSGRRHLRRLVARLKFELGVPIGVAVTIPALWLNPVLSTAGAAGMTVLAACLSIYLLVEALATHDVLGKLRHELLKEDAYGLVPRKSSPLAATISVFTKMKLTIGHSRTFRTRGRTKAGETHAAFVTRRIQNYVLCRLDALERCG